MNPAGTRRRRPRISALLFAIFALGACDDAVRPVDQEDAGQDVEYDLFDGSFYRAPGRLVIEPSPITFDVEGIGISSWETVTFRNEGIGELVIFQIDGEGSDWDQIEIADADLPIGLSPGDSAQLDLAYTPRSCAPLQANLKVAWSDSDEPRAEVELLATGLSAQLAVEPEMIAFGRVGSDTRVSRDLVIANEGLCPLQIDQLDIEGSRSFTLATRDGAPFRPILPLEVTADRPLELAIAFESPVDEPETATLVIGDETAGQLAEVPLSANRRECPVAVASATILEAPREPARDLQAIPLQTVQLDASESFDPDRSVVAYAWEVVERPTDSTAELQPASDVPDPTFFLDLAGNYVFELTVYDDDGLASCNTDQVTVHVVPNEDIHVQLVWHTPDDPNELDYDGTDLDLHLLRLPGQWDESIWDCNWHNMNPDWGESGNAEDDPSLDIDDVDGVGPENINLDHPETGRTYGIGVFYYSDRAMGSSFATVRVFIDGVLVFEQENRELERTGYFWYVGRIPWPSNEVDVVDAMYPYGFP